MLTKNDLLLKIGRKAPGSTELEHGPSLAQEVDVTGVVSAGRPSFQDAPLSQLYYLNGVVSLNVIYRIDRVMTWFCRFSLCG